jgi:transposase
MDLRQHIADAWPAGESKLSLARRFAVGYATVNRYMRQWEQSGSLAPKAHGGGMPRAVDAQGEALLRALLEEKPDLTDAELSERYGQRRGKRASKSSINRALQSIGRTGGLLGVAGGSRAGGEER